MKHNFCDQVDCLLHPQYIEELAKKEKEEQRKKEAMFQSHSHTLPGDIVYDTNRGMVSIANNNAIFNVVNFDGWTNSNIHDTTMRIKTSTVDLPFECTICKHFKKLDMRDILIIEEAKKALND